VAASLATLEQKIARLEDQKLRVDQENTRLRDGMHAMQFDIRDMPQAMRAQLRQDAEAMIADALAHQAGPRTEIDSAVRRALQQQGDETSRLGGVVQEMENALTQLRGEMKGRIAGLEHATVAGAAAQAEDVSLPILRPQIEQLREANSRLGGAVMDLQARQ
jgi:uncharacterized protein (UPF0335 family)